MAEAGPYAPYKKKVKLPTLSLPKADVVTGSMRAGATQRCTMASERALPHLPCRFTSNTKYMIFLCLMVSVHGSLLRANPFKG